MAFQPVVQDGLPPRARCPLADVAGLKAAHRAMPRIVLCCHLQPLAAWRGETTGSRLEAGASHTIFVGGGERGVQRSMLPNTVEELLSLTALSDAVARTE